MAEKLKNQGNEFFKKNKFSEAINAYTKAIQIDPREPTYYTNRASAYIGLNNYEQALSDCKKALEINPNHPRGLTRAARCLVVLGRLDEAKEYLSYADRVLVNDQQVKEEYKNLSDAIQDLKDYKQFLDNQNYSQALHYIEKLIEISSENWEFKKWKIETLLKLGDLNKCGETITAYSGKYQHFPDLVFLQGKMVYYKGQNKDSEFYLKRCLSMDPDFVQAKELLKSIKVNEKAKEDANKLFSEKKNPEAIEAYTHCLQLDPFNKYYNSVILSNRSACYINQKEYIKALTDINKAIDLNPEFAKAYVRRGNIRIYLEEYSEALKDYNKAKEISPGYPDIDNMIASAQNDAQNRKRKDYYKILGIEKGASDDQIKKAFRKAALKWHPDKNSATPEQKMEAEKMFKDVNEAYAVLSDKNKKAIYDNGGDPEGGPSGFSGMGGGIDPSSIFQMFFGGSGGGDGGFASMFSGGPGVFMSSNGGMPGFSRGGNSGNTFTFNMGGGNNDFDGFPGGFPGFPGGFGFTSSKKRRN